MHPPAGSSANRAAGYGVGARSLRLGLACIALGILLAGAWNYRWMADDGLIHLRIVQQIEAGNGPVFNAGERVEASTSPLWTWLLAAADVLLPLPLEWIAVLAGIALSACGLAFAMLGAAELTQASGRSRLLFPLGGLVLAVLPAMWLNASTGLENGLAFAWLGACVWLLARWASGARHLSLWTAALVGVGTLIRPEFVLVSMLLLAAAVGVEAPARGMRGTLRSARGGVRDSGRLSAVPDGLLREPHAQLGDREGGRTRTLDCGLEVPARHRRPVLALGAARHRARRGLRPAAISSS